MKKIIITSIIFLFASSGFAQKNLFAVGWEINFPTNTNYLTKTSYSGGKLDYRHFFKEKKMLKPFVGIALGGQYLQQSLYYNVYVTDDDNWGFVARPEVGVFIKPNEYKEWGFLVAANYSYSTNKTDLIDNNSFKN